MQSVLLARVLFILPAVSIAMGFPLILPSSIAAAEQQDDPGKIIDFARDIKPLIERHCLECHGPTKQDGDFRVDQRRDVFPTYIEPGNAEESEWYDRMISDDPDWVMPPESEGGRLGVGTLALFRVWIDEGADWPDGVQVGAFSLSHHVSAQRQRASLWQVSGVLHPLTVHFPLAMLILGALFALLGLRRDSAFADMAFYCLWLAAVTGVIATLSGWPFSTWKGRGSLLNAEAGSTLFWHGWLGIGVTVLTIVLTVLATASRMKEPHGRGVVWKLGMVVAAVLVGIVGYQGGKLTHGDMYTDALRRLGFVITAPIEPRERGDASNQIADDPAP